MIKKLLFSFGIIAVSITTVQAQIIITQWDIAAIPKMIKTANDTLPTVGIGPAGANVTWNFTALQTNNPGPDTTYFTNPAWTPYQSSFPTANLAVEQGLNGHNGIIYGIINSAGFNIIGQHASIGTVSVNIPVNPVEVLIPFPSTYNTAFNCTSGFDKSFYFGQFSIDSFRIKEKKTKIDKVNAWGTVTTPLLSNQACIRYRSWEHTIDTVWDYSQLQTPNWQIFQITDDTTIRFSWWANGIGFPIVQMDSVSYYPYVKNASWIMATPVSGINEYSSVMNTSAYPNPASNMINLDVTGMNASSIHIMDISGREIEKFNVNNDIETVNVGQFNAGAYLFSVANKEGEIIGRGKFNVIK